MTRKPSTTSLQKKWCNSTSSDIVTCFSVRHASGVTTQNSKTPKPTNTQTMPKSVLRTIVYHLTKATRYCLKRGLRRIIYLGATGQREDHTLGNISLMVRYALEMGVEPLMATDFGWFVVASGDAAFRSFPRQQVSLFNIDCQALETEGLRWNGYPYRQFWQGTLNEAIGDCFTLKADGNYLIYRTYRAKA